MHAFYFSTGGNNLLVSVICECVTAEDCRLEFQGAKLILINSRDFNGLPDRIILCKSEEGEKISFFFPAMDGRNKTCCVIINGIHYPAMIEKLA
ncbi:hypothetical protein [Pseudescherichia sp.]|uniref:hypothetical protein n=1 Tax=Pseudescherichia sp. TaxID=2055881 RepID=UPI0028A1B178|nr:hypothetical protein [Pseudescherichia sp.]